MILKALTLENFKGIREPVRIELAPLTLLFGPNNAGKSTIVQALMYAREVLERNNCDASRTVLGGDVIDLGGFRSLVHGHDLTRSIRMRFELDQVQLHNYIETRDEEDLYDPGLLEWELDSSQNPDDARIQYPTLDELTHGLSQYWVEIEISWVGRAPTVTRYEVGVTGEPFARIILDESGCAGIIATEKSYEYKLDVRDLDEEVAHRYWFASFLGDPKDAVTSSPELPLPELSYPTENPSAEPPPPVYWQGRLREYKLAEASVLHRLIRRLPINALKRSSRGHVWFVTRALPLRHRDSALPPWHVQMDLDERLWRGDDVEPFRTHWEFRDYLAGTLTSLITGPGRCLLEGLRDSVFVSAFREMPSRDHRTLGRINPPSWASGRAAWDALLADEQGLVSNTNQWLTNKLRLDTGYQIVVAKHRELPEDSELWRRTRADGLPPVMEAAWIRDQLDSLVERRRLELTDLRRSITLVPQDLGVGISQVIPVIVAALHHQSGVVMIEEPESNIHPAFQVVLADLFITQAKANPGVMFLVETHSEHLMLRCLRRIRETSEGEAPEDAPSLKPEDLAVHFVEPGDAGPRIHRIRIDENGEFIDPWPRGFFRERAKELFG